MHLLSIRKAYLSDQSHSSSLKDHYGQRNYCIVSNLEAEFHRTCCYTVAGVSKTLVIIRQQYSVWLHSFPRCMNTIKGHRDAFRLGPNTSCLKPNIVSLIISRLYYTITLIFL
ncbi:hypothetical protein RchiOBHm_Chr1g0333761 [Rosa chinensis]|uniref:Uncharacterized protein n=1 Tax=Rosa chinensis TaxID=74649 RepID=A0A2P6SC56_ROSCH|nr:hypothetical protein RchiOBHm_Chr1g0333761 [Rosa chinensis]